MRRKGQMSLTFRLKLFRIELYKRGSVRIFPNKVKGCLQCT